MMARLTTRSEITRETDMSQEWGYSHIYKKLAEYEQAEEDGRLVVLPCKVGDNVFRNVYDAQPHVVEDTILQLSWPATAPVPFFTLCGYRAIILCDIGKTVFLTRAEAESALKAGAIK